MALVSWRSFPAAAVRAAAAVAAVTIAMARAVLPHAAAAAPTPDPPRTAMFIFAVQLSCTAACFDEVVADYAAAGCTGARLFLSLNMFAAACPVPNYGGDTRAAAGGRGSVRTSRRRAPPAVEAWAPDEVVRVSAPAPVPSPAGEAVASPPAGAVDSWGLDRINQAALPLDGNTSTSGCYPAAGAGVHVFVLDSGINDKHAQFAHLGDRLTATVAPGAPFPNGTDELGHGTHVIGTIAGVDTGVAPGVNVTSIKTQGGAEDGSLIDLVAGIDAVTGWAAASPTTPVLLSLSLGLARPPFGPDMLATAVNRAAASGLLTITSAGNGGGDACGATPGWAAAAINVAASNRTDGLAPSSNRGPCVDVVAPGSNIVSADARSATALVGRTGTSMAAPHVTGVAALVLGEAGGRVTRGGLLDAMTDATAVVAGFPLAWASPGRC